jgi:tetraacyldisaccharide 4'-kinase
LGLFEFLYYLGYRVKSAYDLRRQRRLPARVISIGNITVGGTGKTPATVAVVKEALKKGFRPAVLTRGYKGRVKGPCVIDKSMSEKDAGDEPLLMAEKLKGVPVIKGADRYEAGMYALKEGVLSREGGAVPLFVLDDGFQHRRLFRDKDILLINAQDPFGNRKLLPMGPLREPLKEIKRADIIVITKSMNTDCQELIDEIRRYNPQAPVFKAGHSLSYVMTSSAGQLPVEWLSGKSVYGFCGIAEPESFRALLEASGAIVKGFRAYRDHYRYKESDIRRIESAALKSNADWIITTEKDIMRLRVFNTPANLISLGIEFSVDEGFYDEVFNFGEAEG